MAAVMIGIDPAKRSHAMAVLDRHEEQLAALEVGNDSAGYRDDRHAHRLGSVIVLALIVASAIRDEGSGLASGRQSTNGAVRKQRQQNP